MNIFASDESPVISAEHLDDRRVIKMITETAQILSTTLRSLGATDDRLYRSTHRHHPCVVWAGKSDNNFKWLIQHGLAMGDVYTRFSNRQHAAIAKIHLAQTMCFLLPQGEQTEFANCTTFKDEPVHPAYKRYLITKWDAAIDRGIPHLFPQWKERGEPSWR